MTESEKQFEFLKVNRYQVEENAVFIDYEPQKLLSTIHKFTDLKYQERLSIAKNICTVQQAIGLTPDFVQLLIKIVIDQEQIQKELLSYIKQFINDEDKEAIQYLIQPLIKMIQGVHFQVKQEAGDILVNIIKLLPNQIEKERPLNIAIGLSQSENQENKIISIQLLAKMVKFFSEQKIEETFEKHYMRLYQQSTVRVKKEVINTILNIGEVASLDYFQNTVIEKLFLKSCKENAWVLRKACCENLPHLIKIIRNKQTQLVDSLFAFLKDGNKFVRITAHKIIPQLVANFYEPQGKQSAQRVFEQYLKLIDNSINYSTSYDNQIIQKIAFYYPGVLINFGSKKWPQLLLLFDRLMKYKNHDVKIPLASSLHQISKIIGPELAKQHIFKALDLLLKESSDKLKLLSIEHLSQFVEIFDRQTRQNLIDIFLVLQKDPKKWRIRHSIAQQLDHLSEVYQAQIVFKYIFPIALKLCNDNVCQVRNEAGRHIASIIKNLEKEKDYQIMAIQSVKGYAYSSKFVQRQTFCSLMNHQFAYQNLLQEFLPLMQELSKDKIMVVRIALANTINNILKKKPTLQQKLQNILKILRQNEQLSQYLRYNEPQQVHHSKHKIDKEKFGSLNEIPAQNSQKENVQDIKVNQQNKNKERLNEIEEQDKENIIEEKHEEQSKTEEEIKTINQQINQKQQNISVAQS